MNATPLRLVAPDGARLATAALAAECRAAADQCWPDDRRVAAWQDLADHFERLPVATVVHRT